MKNIRSLTTPKFKVGEVAIFDADKWSSERKEEETSFGTISENCDDPMTMQVEIIAASFWSCMCSEFDPSHEDGSQQFDVEGGWRYRVKFKTVESNDPRYDEAEVAQCFLLKIENWGGEQV